LIPHLRFTVSLPNYFKMAAPTLELDPKYDHYDYPTTSPEVRNGHPGHTTPEENAKLFQLRTMLEQEGYKERLDTLTLVCHQNQR
jgi:hypothetical protein